MDPEKIWEYCFRFINCINIVIGIIPISIVYYSIFVALCIISVSTALCMVCTSSIIYNKDCIPLIVYSFYLMNFKSLSCVRKLYFNFSVINTKKISSTNFWQYRWLLMILKLWHFMVQSMKIYCKMISIAKWLLKTARIWINRYHRACWMQQEKNV